MVEKNVFTYRTPINGLELLVFSQAISNRDTSLPSSVVWPIFSPILVGLSSGKNTKPPLTGNPVRKRTSHVIPKRLVLDSLVAFNKISSLQLITRAVLGQFGRALGWASRYCYCYTGFQCHGSKPQRRVILRQFKQKTCQFETIWRKPLPVEPELNYQLGQKLYHKAN